MLKRAAVAIVFSVLSSGVVCAQSDVERGSYLVNTIMTCGNCHSPKGPNGDIPGKEFSGGLRFDEPPFDVTAPNITQDNDTGIGKWSRADIKKLLLQGVKPDGTRIAVVMPTGFYNILTPGDLNAIVAYLHTLKPIGNKVPAPIYKIKLERQIFPGAEKSIAPSDLRNKLKRGFYLATIGHCMECHSPMTPQGADFKTSLGKGGQEFPGPWGVSKSSNITPSKKSGIGAWSNAEIKRAVTQGISRDGRKMLPPMGYPYYARMTDADLDAVIAYLRTLPAKD